MSLPATAVIEVRTTGDDANGGGFNSARGGADYTQVDGVATTTGTVTSAASTVTATTAIFASNMVGNYITDGTTWKEITGFISTTVVTVDSAPSWTAASIRVGGAIKSLGRAGGISVASNTVWIKTGAYSVTSASTNVAGGCYTGVSLGNCLVEGYSTSRGDRGTPPVFTASGISSATFIVAGTNSTFRNIVFDGASLSTIRGAVHSACSFHLIWIKNCTNSGILTGAGKIVCCRVTGCGTTGSAFNIASTVTLLEACEAYDNTVPGFAGPGNLVRCASYRNTVGFSAGANIGRYINCVSYNNSSDGFNANTSTNNHLLINCISEHNGGYGYNFDSTTSTALINCAGYLNTSGNVSSTSAVYFDNLNFLVGSTTFFVNAASGNFALVVGSPARAAGFIGVLPAGTTTGYEDIGIAQHPDPTQPIAGDVESGVVYNDGQTTGTFTVPAQGDVRTGTGYGAGGTEFTGTLTPTTTVYNQTGLFI